MASGVIVGIDLGTTNSVAALFRPDGVEFIENELDERLTPSVVTYDKRSKMLLVGRTAKDMLATAPHLGAAAFKRYMGHSKVFELGPRKLGPIELSAYVLESLKRDTERALGHPVDRCVVTVPAYFNESQRFATKQAAEAAGLSVERVLNEPTAAAIAYGLNRKDDESTFLVFDLGGGTFDVCVMELFEGMLAVKGVAGDSRLGGEDFTEALVNLVCETVDLPPEQVRSRDPAAYALLHKRSELLKRQLSSWKAGEIVVPAIDGVTKESTSIEITAAQAKHVFAPLLDRLVAPCRSALRGAKIAPSDLAEVVMVGGATRMPWVRELVTDLFHRPPLVDLDPDLVVAQGAAIQAGLCADDTALCDVVVTDVASHSLGVDTSRTIAKRHYTGYFSPIIHRNTVIPTSRTETYFPLEKGQREILFGVYEGEARRTENNVKIGEIAVEGLPRAQEDAAVAVTFTYDLNGILEVEAKVVKTGKTVTRVFTREGQPLRGIELEQAESRLRRIKQDPAEKPRNKDLLTRANMLWRECAPDQREALGVYIDAFDAALVERDEEAIHRAFAELLAACEAIDGGERW